MRRRSHNGGEIAYWDLPILAYHQITGHPLLRDDSGLAMPVGQFDRQMRFLHERGYRCVSLSELLCSWDTARLWPAKTISLTFDDGYQDFFQHAFPTLVRFGFTAAVFLVTDRIGKESEWEGERGTPLLTWKQVQDLDQAGIEIGSHTCTHPRLPQVARWQVQHELVASKEWLEARLGREVPFLAYPHGESDPEVQAAARAAGYQAAFGVSRARNGRFNIWRRECRRDESLLAFSLKLAHGYNYPAYLREQTRVGRALRSTKRRFRL